MVARIDGWLSVTYDEALFRLNATHAVEREYPINATRHVVVRRIALALEAVEGEGRGGVFASSVEKRVGESIGAQQVVAGVREGRLDMDAIARRPRIAVEITGEDDRKTIATQFWQAAQDKLNTLDTRALADMLQVSVEAQELRLIFCAPESRPRQCLDVSGVSA